MSKMYTSSSRWSDSQEGDRQCTRTWTNYTGYLTAEQFSVRQGRKRGFLAGQWLELLAVNLETSELSCECNIWLALRQLARSQEWTTGT